MPANEAPKKGRGRPRGRVYDDPTQVRLTPEQKAHLRRKYRTVSEGVRKLVNLSMMRESLTDSEIRPDDRKYLMAEYGDVATGIKQLIEKDKGSLPW
jgi:hypothetical protein